jgi:hypothetical protein
MPVYKFTLMNRFKQLIVISFSLAVLTACSSKDTQFCNCLKASAQLNELSNDLLRNTFTDAKAAQLLRLKKLKKEQCLEYVYMDGKEMLERKKACKKLKK